MATNLNIENRNQIKDAIINKTFAAQVEDLQAKRVALADAIYFETVPPEFIKLANRPEVPAKGWFDTSEYVEQASSCENVKIASIKSTVGRKDSARMSERRPVPSDLHCSWGGTLYLKVTPETKALVEAFNADVQRFHDQKEDAASKLHTLLYSVRTVEKLIEVAPELAQFIPEQFKKPKPQLPMIKSDDVIATLVKAGLKLK